MRLRKLLTTVNEGKTLTDNGSNRSGDAVDELVRLNPIVGTIRHTPWKHLCKKYWTIPSISLKHTRGSLKFIKHSRRANLPFYFGDTVERRCVVSVK